MHHLFLTLLMVRLILKTKAKRSQVIRLGEMQKSPRELGMCFPYCGFPSVPVCVPKEIQRCRINEVETYNIYICECVCVCIR